MKMTEKSLTDITMDDINQALRELMSEGMVESIVEGNEANQSWKYQLTAKGRYYLAENA